MRGVENEWEIKREVETIAGNSSARQMRENKINRLRSCFKAGFIQYI